MRKISKPTTKDKKKKLKEEEKHLVEEIGDLLFAIVCLANANNISLEEAIKQKFKKIQESIQIEKSSI